jgi:hypothetical protein
MSEFVYRATKADAERHLETELTPQEWRKIRKYLKDYTDAGFVEIWDLAGAYLEGLRDDGASGTDDDGAAGTTDDEAFSWSIKNFTREDAERELMSEYLRKNNEEHLSDDEWMHIKDYIEKRLDHVWKDSGSLPEELEAHMKHVFKSPSSISIPAPTGDVNAVHSDDDFRLPVANLGAAGTVDSNEIPPDSHFRMQVFSKHFELLLGIADADAADADDHTKVVNIFKMLGVFTKMYRYEPPKETDLELPAALKAKLDAATDAKETVELVRTAIRNVWDLGRDDRDAYSKNWYLIYRAADKYTKQHGVAGAANVVIHRIEDDADGAAGTEDPNEDPDILERLADFADMLGRDHNPMENLLLITLLTKRMTNQGRPFHETLPEGDYSTSRDNLIEKSRNGATGTISHLKFMLWCMHDMKAALEDEEYDSFHKYLFVTVVANIFATQFGLPDPGIRVSSDADMVWIAVSKTKMLIVLAPETGIERYVLSDMGFNDLVRNSGLPFDEVDGAAGTEGAADGAAGTEDQVKGQGKGKGKAKSQAKGKAKAKAKGKAKAKAAGGPVLNITDQLAELGVVGMIQQDTATGETQTACRQS